MQFFFPVKAAALKQQISKFCPQIQRTQARQHILLVSQRTANMHQRAKFRVDCVNRCGDMAVFRFFKMAAVRHLGFLKLRNFNCPSCSEGQYASPSQISCRSVEPLRRHGCFSESAILGGVRHLGFLKVRNFIYRSDREGQYSSPCQILCRSVELLRRYG